MRARTDRLLLEYRLIFLSPFHFGTGFRQGLVDRTVARDRQGHLYVPGASFKGALRECCEQLARTYDELDEMSDLLTSPHDARQALRSLGARISMITRIFGSQMLPGTLFFDNARLLSAAEAEPSGGTALATAALSESPETQVVPYTQVRLRRLTRTAVPGALYTSEFGRRQLLFRGTIRGWLTCLPLDEEPRSPTYSLLLLLAGLHLIEQLGANKSTGKGRCRCEILRLEINGEEYPAEEWRGWLMERLDELVYYAMAQGEAME
ncbi:RAMP superfamily CRISPR-associated protein [Thermogemmatispora sp.]|uniref:RAMP superfamily CRISPR-associated protein n=1 Tax=Thermogemmatispora sp. TaxID=1968838 RepID=UPI0035E45E71